MSSSDANTAADIDRAMLIDFVYREARLLDQRRYRDWLDLFAADGVYWLPLEPQQTDHRTATSLLYEDRFLLELRIERLDRPRTYSQQPPSRGHHLLQRPEVERFDPAGDEFIVTTAFHYVETRADEQNLYAAWSRHELTRVDGELKIRLKRVDLVNCDAAFGNIQLFL